MGGEVCGQLVARQAALATQWEAHKPLILNGRNRFAFQFGRASGLRLTGDIVDQLQSQLAAERAQHASKMSELQKETVSLLRRFAEVRLEIARRDEEAFARLEDPSATRHQASSKQRIARTSGQSRGKASTKSHEPAVIDLTG